MMGILWNIHGLLNGNTLGGEHSNRMKNQIITISRTYGSGGSQIGPLVAEKLGVPCYDRNSIDRIAREQGLDRLYISAWKDEMPSVILWGADEETWNLASFMRPHYFSEKKMFLIQSQIIKELAENGPCIFVGRCADHVLSDWKPCLRVWISANEDSRALRLYNEYFIRTGSLAEKLRIVDKGRAAYYKRCTGQVWGESQNYHLHLDSGVLGVGGCVDTILSASCI